MPPSILLQSYGDLAASVADRLAGSRSSGHPFAPWTLGVIVASSGVARAIAAELSSRLPAGVAGLRLETIDSFARRILNERGQYPRAASPAERRLAMRTAARLVDHPMMETRGTPAMLERSYRDMRDSGLTLAALGARSRPASLRNRDRFRAVFRAWEEYERLITRLGAMDPADILAAAAREIASGTPLPQQIAAGFYDVTGAQFEVLAALRSVESLAAVHVPFDRRHPSPYAFAAPFLQRLQADALALEPTAEIAHLPIRAPEWSIAEHRTREDEARAVCGAIGDRLAAGAPPQSIGVVARALEPYDLHLFERFAREQGFAFSAGSSTPLAAHRIGRGVATLLRLRERDFPRSDVLEVVRSGLKVKTRINADKADLATREELIAGGPSAALQARCSGKSPVLGDYVALVAELEELTARVDAASLRRATELFRIEDSADLAALQELDEISAMFTRAERWNRPLDTYSFLDAIEQATISASPPPKAGPVVWIGDVMRLRGRTFEHLYAVRMQEDVLPQRRTEDPLLPDADRRQLGIREIGDGRDEEVLLFELMRGSGVTHFSYAASDGFGKPLRPSQLLKGFAIEQNPEKKAAILKRFASVTAAPAPKVDRPDRTSPALQRRLQLLARAGSRSVFDGYVPSPILREHVSQALQSISPTQLEDFGECPQKFLIKHLLGVRALDDPDRDVQINRREKGKADHRVLERFYRASSEAEIRDAAADLPRLSPHLASRLEQLIDEEFDLLDQTIPPFNRSMREMERRATKRLLRDFVAEDIADLLDRGLFPAHFEYRFGTRRRREPDHPEPFILESHGTLIRVEGTIDRIDVGSETFRIVDYKSGKAGRHEDLAVKIDRGVRLQLPLYAMAVASFFGADPDRVSAAVKPLVRSDTDPEKFAFNLADAHQRLRETVEIFVRAISRGAFPAFPNEDDKDFQSCKYCPVSHSCRTRHDPDERRAALEAGDPRSILQQEVPS